MKCNNPYTQGGAMPAHSHLGDFWSLKAAAFALALAASGCAQAATTVTTTTSFDYDLVTGQLKKQVIEPGDSSLCLATQYGRDSYGHVLTTTTRNCNGSAAVTPGAMGEAVAPTGDAVFPARVTTDTYSTDQRFVVQTENAVGHTETKTYDPKSGQLASVTGPNQLTTTWAYDSLGRKKLETRADNTKTKWSYVFCTYAGYLDGYAWPAGSNTIPAGAETASCGTVSIPARFMQGGYYVGPSTIKPLYYVQTTSFKADGVTPDGPAGKTYYDIHNREIRSETQGFDGSGSSEAIYQDTTYGLDGFVNSKTRPWSASTAKASIVYERDILGRVTREYENGQFVETTYSGLLTTVTDRKGYVTRQLKNTAGQTAQITDAKSGTLASSYDPLGNLVRTTDAKGNVISMAYDTRGRKTAMYDPDMGTWTYAYNALGELIRQTDAKNQVTTQTFDKLGRMTQRVEIDSTSDWYYDKYADNTTCTKGRGKLCEATARNDYRRKNFYDADLGRLTSVSTVTNGKVFAVTYGYSAESRLVSQTYPTGLQLTTSYTPLGFPWKVIDARTGSALWTLQAQSARGQALQYLYGNNVATSNTYFYDGRLNATQSGAGGTLQNLVYNYDANRNVSTRMDLGTGVTATYGYDELNRLTSESRSGGALTGTQTLGWGYDAIGNMVSRTDANGTATYNYNTSGLGSRRPHAVGSVSGFVSAAISPTYTYDANGNLQSGAGRTVAWTSANRVQSVSANGKQLAYLYGPEHERTKETYVLNGVEQRKTVYINQGDGLFYEEETGVAGTKMKHYVNAGGSTVAMIVCTANPCTNTANSSTQYWHEDHLGSVSVVTNASGGVVERMAYEPFGKRRNANGTTDASGTLVAVTTDRGYTEHEHMEEMALVNMNGRIYDPALGRFMSADPSVAYPDSTQGYNRYSYVQNNPLGFIDPTGFEDSYFGDGVCLSCERPVFENYSPSGGGDGGGNWYATLPGNIDCFSCGTMGGDPLSSYSFSVPQFRGDALAFQPVFELPAVSVKATAEKEARSYMAGTMALGAALLDVAKARPGLAVGVGIEVAGVLARNPLLSAIGFGVVMSTSGDTPKTEGTALQVNGAESAAGGAAPPPPEGDNNDKGEKQKKGKPERNVDQNKRVDEAAREAGLDKQQRRELGRYIEQGSRKYGENYSYRDILDAAERIKGGERLINIK